MEQEQQGRRLEQQQPNSAFDTMLAEIASFIAIEDTELREQRMKEVIEARMQTLHAEAPEKQTSISLLRQQPQTAFIHPETDIRRNFLVDAFHVNDPDIYRYLLTAYKKIYDSWQQQKPIRAVLGYAIQYALGDYFGNYYSNNTTERNNVAFYMDHTSIDSDPINLQELKGKNIAVCAEKASVAHNFLCFLGVDSALIFSNNCQIEGADGNSGHAYIVLKTKNGQFIFDPTNPVMVERGSDVAGVQPALYPISEEAYQSILARKQEPVTVTHVDQTIDEQGTYHPQPPTRRSYS